MFDSQNVKENNRKKKKEIKMNLKSINYFYMQL